MDIYQIEPTRVTPRIFFDPENGTLHLAGRSSPDNGFQFYERLIKLLHTDIQAKEITVEFKLEYFNTSSAKTLFEMFKRLSHLNENGYKVVVNWYVEENDEDLLETGEDFEELTRLPFNYIVY